MSGRRDVREFPRGSLKIQIHASRGDTTHTHPDSHELRLCHNPMGGRLLTQIHDALCPRNVRETPRETRARAAKHPAKHPAKHDVTHRFTTFRPSYLITVAL